MSGFPGLPFRSVDPFTLSQTPVFRAASLSPLPPGLTGYPPGFLPCSRSFYDPLLPLSPRISSPALPIGFTRAELPYASSLLDPRNQLLRSPNYYLSPNASPLTFDQINSQKDKEVTSLAYEARYRSNSDLGSLARLSVFAPEPHYKTFVSGTDNSRHSFPLSPVLDRSAKDSPKYPSFISPKLKSDHTERKDTKPENQEKKDKPKLWKPFETDSPQKTGDKVKESEGESAVKDKCNNNIGDSVVKSDLHGNSVEGSSNNNNKKEHPTRPIPHYPSGVPKSAISEKNTSFTTFQPWKNDTRVNEATEHKTVSDSFGKTVSGTVHYKPDNRQYNYPQEQSKFESGTRYSHNISEKKFPDQLVNGVAHNLETVSTDQLNTTPENVAVSILRSGVSNTVTAEGLTETETENQSVTELKSNNQLASNDTKVEEFGAVENINSNCIPNTDTEVLNINETEINCLKSDSRGANHDTSGENVNINYKSESHIEIGSEVNKETKVEIENNTTNDIKDHSEISDELDDDKIKTKSTGKQRRISEVCASLLSLSHVTDSVSSAECAKTTDSVPVDNHSAINKSSSAELSKRKRRNSSLDKHTDLTERAPNSRTVKEPGYRTDYNFNQIGFEQQMSAMSGSCVQGYNNQVSCQSGMRHPYNYNENAVSYPPNMAGKNNQSFQDGLSHENAKTLPNHDAKQSISDFKMMKQSKVLTNAPQEQPQSDSFNQRLSNQNEYKSSPHDNSSKCSPARMSSSSSGTGPLSYGIFDTDSNTDSNFATSVSNAETNSTDIEPNVEVQSEPPFEWDYLHSKQFVDVIYKNQGCEFSGVVKSDLEIRESDSPKTFLDLDTITKPKPKANVSKSQGLDSMYSGMSDNQNYHRKQTSSPYYNQNTKGNSYNSQWGPQRANQNEYISGDTGTGAKGEGFGSNSNQGNQNYGNDYQKYSQTSQSNGVSQYDSSKGYQSQYNSQSNSGSSYYMSNHQHSQSGYHGNNYNESNQYYDPNQNSNQSYSSGQGYSNSYQNMNQQYGNSGYRGHSTGQNYQSNSHSPSSNQSYLPSNVENPEIDMVATPPKKEYKKRGRKRKAEKEQELNEQALNRPNTIVALLPNVGPLIHSENHTDSVDSYDYLNNPVETIFDYTYDESLPPIANQLLQIEQELCQRLLPLKYGYPVNVIYNPLVYAFQTHRDFVTKYCTSQRPILFLGMNPGPYGMSQNGVPFGEVTVVKDWLKVVGPIFKPESEHPKKPVLGLTCTRIEDEEDGMKLPNDIDRLGSWARKWGVRFQPVKCNMMHLTRKQIKKIHASYTLEGTDLENVESIKYLGVTITSDLRWNTHVSNVCTKANRTLGFLRRNLYSCPQEEKEAVYKGLVRPVLDYGSLVWDPPGVVLQEELESVQKRAARFVTGNYNYETGSMTGILGQLKWESLKKRRKDNRLILQHKGLKGKASVPTDDLIHKTRHCRNQHSMAFQTPIANTDVYKDSFFPQTIRDWNALPDSLTSSAEDAEDCVAKFTFLVSGARFWGLFQRICRVPENFFRNCYVANFCPQAYLSESGKNITPPQLAPNEVEPINKNCDAALVELVRLLNTRIIIAVGKYVQTRASKALHNAGIRNVTVECILHPSPINPHANKGWEQIVAKQLIEIGVMQYLNTDREDVQRHIDDWERAAMAAASAKTPEIHE